MLKSPSLPRVLLDECLPKKLKGGFAACTVSTVTERGWAGRKNGALMQAARDQFDVFVTADRNLQFQQNLAYAQIGVVVLVAVNNRMETLAPLMPQVNKVLKTIAAGQVIEVKLGDG